MNFKFKLVDLFVLTGLVAMMFGAMHQDFSFFRRLFLMVVTAAISTFGVMMFSKQPNRAWVVGAIFGGMTGLAFVAVSFWFVDLFYFGHEVELLGGQDPALAAWAGESGILVIAAAAFGSAIGPMIRLHVGGQPIPQEFSRLFQISFGILAVILLIGVLRMIEQLVNFGNARDLAPLMLVALAVFVVFTNGWLYRYHASLVAQETAADPDQSEANAT